MKKYLLLILISGSVLTSFAADEPAPKTEQNRTAMNITRIDLAETVFRHFMDSNPAAARSESVYFLGIADGDAQVVVAANESRYKAVLKTGSDYVRKEGILYDNATGRPCTVINVKVESINGDDAVVTLQWSASNKAGGGIAYSLRKVSGTWKVEKELARFAS